MDTPVATRRAETEAHLRLKRLALLYRWNQRPLDAAGLMEKILWLRPDPVMRQELLDVYRGVGRN